MAAKDASWGRHIRGHQPWRSKRLHHHIFLVTAVLIIVWLTYNSPSTRSHFLPRLARIHRFQQPLTNHDFVSLSIQSTLDAYNSTAIQQYCAHSSWNISQAVFCDPVLGGISDARQTILSCLHYAMQFGMGFILPTMYLRSSDPNLQHESIRETPFNHNFNQELFMSRLSAACPNMPIYEDIESAKKAEVELLHFPTSPGRMNICDDDPSFAANFGSLLTFPESIYRLAFSAFHTLSTQQHLSIEPSPLSGQFKFLGVHLQPSSATAKSGSASTSYEEKCRNFLSLATALNIPVIYVASEDSLFAFQLMAEAAVLSPPIAVVAKENLLSGGELEELGRLTWDQAALVDHVILQSAGFFAGTQESSFSWSVTISRARYWGG